MKEKYKQISVYDKTGVLLADFTKETFSQSLTIIKNKAYTAMVHEVQNGESTLTVTMFKDSAKWQRVKNPENEWHCNGKVYSALNQNSYTFADDLVTATLVEIWYKLSKDYAQVHNVDTAVEAVDEHTIKILPKAEMKNKLTINGVKYEDSVVKDINDTLQPRGSAGYALWALTKASSLGWKLGVCDVIVEGFNAEQDFGIFNLELDMKDLLHAIKYVQELWGGIIVWDSTNKLVHLRDEEKNTSFNK